MAVDKEAVENEALPENKGDGKPKLATISQVFSFANTPQIRLRIFSSCVFAVISGAVFPAMAFYFAFAFEELAADSTGEDFMQTVRELAFAFLIMGAIVFVSMTAQATLMELAAREMTNKFKIEWFKALMRQDVAYFDIMDVSGEGSIITINARKYRKGVGAKLANALQFFVTFCGGIGYAVYASWQVSLAVLAIAPFVSLSAVFLIKMNASVTARANESYAAAGSIVNESVYNIRTILSLNAVEIMIQRFKKATQEAFDGATSQVAWVGLANGSNMASMLLSYVVVTLFGSWLLYDAVRDEGCDPSGSVEGRDRCDPAGVDVFGALMGVTFAAAVLPQISVTVEAFVSARAACYPAFCVMNRKTASSEDETAEPSNAVVRRGGASLPKYVIDSSSKDGKVLDKVQGEIRFNDVCFHYPTRQEKEVFDHFNLTIRAGKTVALVGFSGSGKSTAVQLIERFYDPISGSITLDGVDLKDLNVAWLRRQMAFVQQEPKLFECSVRENIAMGKEGATDEEIQAAAKMANAHDFVLGFPKGYDTDVGALGDQLSGGQRQRICIARCLVKNPAILLLDEATSALDSESERSVQRALDDVMKLKAMTTVVIAHRLSTIRNADTIAVVDDGKIIEAGSHEELMEKQSHYYRLAEAQKTNNKEQSKEELVSSEHDSDSFVANEDDTREEDAIVEFHEVGFEYPARPEVPVFTDLNLKVRRGETLALVGPSGCGKSTTIQLMECFYRPTSGIVRYMGTDMKELNVRWLRDQIGLVSQQPTLFDCTIEENIRYSLPDATQEQVIDAAKQANAHNFISEFPDGYRTRVGEGSTLISGGQKQRICIARALIKRPTLLLLDEATSALDSESEKIVQAALDEIMFDKNQTCVVIAHRLSTIRSADRIAVVDKGRICEIGTHDELMAKPNGKYQRLQVLQDLDIAESTDNTEKKEDTDAADTSKMDTQDKDDESEIIEADKELDAKNATRARLLAAGDLKYFLAGAVGAVFASFVFPSWGFVFAYTCPSLGFNETDPRCDEYEESVADTMQDESLSVFYGFLGIIFSALGGFTLLFWGFGVASERMNKRIRDQAFNSLLRQEISWFDIHSPAALTSRLSDDSALIHSFTGEPIRTLTSAVSSVLVGVLVAFVYMWPFALLTLGILPFMAFGAEMEMAMYYGEDEGDDKVIDASSPGGIVIEVLSNIRAVASLTLEEERASTYKSALEREDPHPLRSNVTKGGAAGLGQFVQMWGCGLMFWWGGWLLNRYPDEFSYKAFLISMFALLFSLYGLAIAAEGAVDRKKAQRAAARVFELIDRQSAIDPLSEEGKKGGFETVRLSDNMAPDNVSQDIYV